MAIIFISYFKYVRWLKITYKIFFVFNDFVFGKITSDKFELLLNVNFKYSALTVFFLILVFATWFERCFLKQKCLQQYYLLSNFVELI